MTSDTSLAEEAHTALDKAVGLLPGGERRHGQRVMTWAVSEAIASEGHAVITAGTGIGKTLAYLIPTVLSGKRTIIATATKALQDQLADKDLPFLAKHLGVDVNFAVLKGRSNYLCLQRLDEAMEDNRGRLSGFGKSTMASEAESTPVSLSDATVKAVKKASASTSSGERDRLGISLSDPVWRELSVSGDECPGATKCRRGEDCFAEQARARAAQADIVIVNHHLYALAVRFARLLGDHHGVVIDEAHEFEEIVSNEFGRQVAPNRFRALSRRARRLKADFEVCEAVKEMSEILREELRPWAGKRLTDGGIELADTLAVAASRVSRLREEVKEAVHKASAKNEAKAQRLLQATDSLLESVNSLRSPSENDIVWVEDTRIGPILRTTPLRIDEILSEELWPKRAAVLTSATIPPEIRKRTGLPDSCVKTNVGSPFDYQTNAMLYCPTGLPAPTWKGSNHRRLDELETLITAAGGRTLALFTSYAAMNAAAQAMQRRLKWPILLQGTDTKAALLEDFAKDEHVSLFATISFWQGVDVPGRTCSLVVIDKLPFPRPDDPVLEARRELAGADAFLSIDIPKAATLLTQGVGRLIRTAQDRGVVAVLDSRLMTRQYGVSLIRMLPPMQITSKRYEAINFLREVTS